MKPRSARSRSDVRLAPSSAQSPMSPAPVSTTLAPGPDDGRDVAGGAGVGLTIAIVDGRGDAEPPVAARPRTAQPPARSVNVATNTTTSNPAWRPADPRSVIGPSVPAGRRSGSTRAARP